MVGPLNVQISILGNQLDIEMQDRQKTIQKNHLDLRKRSLYKYLGGPICSSCGYDKDVGGLIIDHIFNTGNLDRKRFKSRAMFYQYYLIHPIEAINNLQILCSTCNQIKKYYLQKGGV